MVPFSPLIVSVNLEKLIFSVTMLPDNHLYHTQWPHPYCKTIIFVSLHRCDCWNNVHTGCELPFNHSPENGKSKVHLWDREKAGQACLKKSASLRRTWPTPWRPSHWGMWWRLQSVCLICTSPMPWKMSSRPQSSAAGTSTRWQAPSGEKIIDGFIFFDCCFFFFFFCLSCLLAFKPIGLGLLGHCISG